MAVLGGPVVVDEGGSDVVVVAGAVVVDDDGSDVVVVAGATVVDDDCPVCSGFSATTVVESVTVPAAIVSVVTRLLASDPCAPDASADVVTILVFSTTLSWTITLSTGLGEVMA